MSSSDVERYMGSTLAALGFDLDGIDPHVTYGERPAWAVFYRGPTANSKCAGRLERAELTSCWPH